MRRRRQHDLCFGMAARIGVAALASVLALPRPAAAGLAVWTSNGPYAGYIGQLAIAPSDPNVLYAADYYSAAVFRSDNGGDSWTRCATNPSSTPSALAVDPSAPNTVYAGFSSGFWKSTDGCSTWAQLGNGTLGNTDMIAVDPSSPSTLLARSNGHLFKSTDGGAAWTQADTGVTVSGGLAFDSSQPGVVYAGTSGAVLKSTNSGGSWTQLPVAGFSGFVNAVAVDPQAPATVYAAGYAYRSEVYKSTNGGASWSRASTGLPADASSAYDIVVTPTAVFVGFRYNSVYKSTNAGANWAPLNVNTAPPSVQVLVGDPAVPNRLFAASDGAGVFRSDDGGTTWHGASQGLVPPRVSALVADPQHPGTVYSADSSSVHKSTDGGQSWGFSGYGHGASGSLADSNAFVVDPANPSILYSASWIVFKSSDAGQSWTATGPGLPGDNDVTALAIGPGNPATLYASVRSQIYKSINSGGLWTVAGAALPGYPITCLAVAPAQVQTVYAGTGSNGVYKSTNSGGSWTAINNGLPSTGVHALAVAPANPAVVYVATDAGVAKTVDGGVSWGAASLGLGAVQVLSLAIDPTSPSKVFAGVWGAVFRSLDGGTQWAALGDGLAGQPVRSLLVDPSNPHKLLAGTDGGVFSLEIPAGCYLSCSAAVPSQAAVNAPVALQAMASASECAGAATYDWDFGDGSALGHEASVSHAYAVDGQYTWTVTVAQGGQSCTKTGRITILPCSLRYGSSASAGRSGGAAPLTVPFTLAVTATNCVAPPAFAWEFGDGGSSTLQNPSHRYGAPGIYTWTAQATSGAATFSRSGTVTVVPTCEVTCSGSTTGEVGAAPLDVDFGAAAASTNCDVSATTFAWAFGDGGVAAGARASHTFAAPGSYAATMTATLDGTTCSKTGEIVAQVPGVNVWATGGPDGGGVFDLAVDPRNHATLYALTATAGLFKTTDGGGHWRPANRGLGSGSFAFIEVDPTSPDRLYLAGSSRGLFTSGDAGASWMEIPGQSHDTAFGPLRVDPWDSRHLVSAAHALLESHDGGGTWSVRTPPGAEFMKCVLFVPPRRLLAGGGWGDLYKSDNGGSWSSVGDLPVPNDMYPEIAGLAGDPAGGSRVLAAKSVQIAGRGIFGSTDGGSTWSLLGDYLPSSYSDALAFDAGQTQVLYAASDYVGGFYRSSDSGHTWTKLDTGLRGDRVKVLESLTGGSGTLLAGTSAGVFSSTNHGASFTSLNHGLVASQVTSLARDGSSTSILYAATSGQGVFKSTDGGTSWALLPGPWPMRFAGVVATDPKTPGVLFVGSAKERFVYKSINGGTTWAELNPGPAAYGYRNVKALAIDPRTPSTVFVAFDYVNDSRQPTFFRTTDGGAHWSPLTNGLTVHYASGDSLRSIDAIAVDPVNAGVVYAVDASRNTLLRSTDNGASWSVVFAAEYGQGSPFSELLLVDPHSPMTLYSVYGWAVTRSTDGGAHWSVISSDFYAQSLALDPNVAGTLYAGNRDGEVWVTHDAGAIWERHGSGMPPVDVNVLLPGVQAPGGAGAAPLDRVIAGTDAGAYYVQIDESLACTLSGSAQAAATAKVGVPAAFAATATAGNCSGFVAYDWDFGDGSPHSSQQSPAHSYVAPGTYPWSVTASVGGQTSTKTGSITVASCSLACSVTPNHSSGGAPLAVTFAATVGASSCLAAPAYAWTFGDGATSTAASPSHTYAGVGSYPWSVTVTADDQTCTASGTVEVLPCSLSCSASATPPTSAVPVAATFASTVNARYCGGPPAFAWDLGDGATATEANPSHTYSQVGSYPWTLTVTAGDQTCTASGTVEALGPACSGPYHLIIPAAAHSNGVWQSDVDLLNLGASPASVDIALLKSSQANLTPQAVNVSVPSGQALRIPDILGGLLPATNAALAFRFCSGEVFASSRFYNIGTPTTGTFGMAVPAMDPTQAITDTRPGVFHNLAYSPDAKSGYRVNLGFANASPFPVNMIVKLYGDSGELLGSKPFSLRAYTQLQWTKIHQLVGTPPVAHGWASVETTTRNAVVLAYAMLIDNLSQDPLSMLPELLPNGLPAVTGVAGEEATLENSTLAVAPCTGPYSVMIPAAAHANAVWQSDVDLLNLGSSPASLDIALLKTGETNLNVQVTSVEVPSGQTLRLPDILGAMLPATNAALGFRFCSGEAFASSRFYNIGTPATGTFGMAVPGLPVSQAITPAKIGVFHHMSYSTDPKMGYRVNLGFANASPFPVGVIIKLYGDSGELLGTKPFSLRAYTQLQWTKIHQLMGTPAVAHGYATVEVTTPNAVVHAYEMLIDNVSQDPAYFAPDVTDKQ